MNGLRVILAIIFMVATIIGIVGILYIASAITTWVLFPFAVLTLGFVTYFLIDGIK
jgi:hypothetical protein